MSQEPVTKNLQQVGGFYGKLPLRGDFVSRRLPREFVSGWDVWLQSAISASREQLDTEWLDIYLTSPLWRFVMSAGLCGPMSWAGVLMPSVDRVGRYFPLTLAVPVHDHKSLPYLFSIAEQWFENLEELALATLEDDFDLEQFDDELQRLTIPLTASSRDYPNSSMGQNESRNYGKTAFQIGMEQIEDITDAVVSLSGNLLEKFLGSYSLWHTVGSERVQASLIACEGLPPIEAFTAMLNGEWKQRGWNIQTDRVLFTNRNANNQDMAVKNKPIDEAQPGGILSAITDLSSTVIWESSGSTNVGKVRKINEDAYLERPDIGLWVVADGMGGHQAGDAASRCIVESLKEAVPHHNLKALVEAVSERLQAVNRELCRLGAEQFDNRVVGSTVVALMANSNRCAFLWAGDSRLYRYRDGALVQLTRDHSLFEELSEDSLLQEDADSSNSCNIVTRAVGAENELILELGRKDALIGDIFLLCSDGLTKEVTPPEIERILPEGNCQTSAQSLMDLAVKRGARDNVTVIVVRVVKA